MNYMEKAGNDTDITPPQDHIPNLTGKGMVTTLIKKHGTGISRSKWWRDHEKY